MFILALVLGCLLCRGSPRQLHNKDQQSYSWDQESIANRSRDFTAPKTDHQLSLTDVIDGLKDHVYIRSQNSSIQEVRRKRRDTFSQTNLTAANTDHLYGGYRVKWPVSQLGGNLTNNISRQPAEYNISPRPEAKPLRDPASILRNWHVGIYDTHYNPYKQICGGTLVTMKAVISAAHCFWMDEGMLPASRFAVATGKLYRSWDDPEETFSQKSNVSAIHIPVRFRGVTTSFQDDIAVVLLAREFTPTSVVHPVCLNFEDDLDTEHLEKGNLGTILGWGLTKENGRPSKFLNYLELPSVPIDECMASVDPNFLKFITSDKICAGVTTGKAVCRGDSGGGLVFFSDVGYFHVPYLRGVASTASRDENDCNVHTLAAFTHVLPHRAFLKRHIQGLEKECKTHYPFVQEIDDRNVKMHFMINELVCKCT